MIVNTDVFSTRKMLPEFRHILWNIRGFQEAYAFHLFLQHKKRILILGETSGRDSHFFSAQGKEVYAVDIVVSPYKIDRLVIANVTKPLPFPAGYFDGIIMSEILEHLIDDLAALREVRRVLADDGVLAVSVPFFQEWPNIHLRLHSASTIRALFEYSGFTVESLFERWAWLNWNQSIQLLCTIIFQIARILRLVNDRDDIYIPILKFIADHNFKQHRIVDPRHPPKYWGGYIKARKGFAQDSIHLQVEVFSKVSNR